jgi:methylglutaconyl-CoA hydratase
MEFFGCDAMDDIVLLSRDNRGVATITLNRPDKRNAFDAALIKRLDQIIFAVAADNAIRIVVLTGAGTMFSAGADLAHMKRQGTMSEQENVEDALQFANCLRALDRLGKPVIARVNGGAYGGGVGLIACADIAVGVSSAKFALTEVRFGIVPAVISPYVVAAIGERHARRWFLTSQAIDAASAFDMGLLHQVVDTAMLDQAVDTYVAALLKGGPNAQREAKALIRDVNIWPEAATPENTARLLAQLRASAEGKEGLTAFFEERKPTWDPSR